MTTPHLTISPQSYCLENLLLVRPTALLGAAGSFSKRILVIGTHSYTPKRRSSTSSQLQDKIIKIVWAKSTKKYLYSL